MIEFVTLTIVYFAIVYSKSITACGKGIQSL